MWEKWKIDHPDPDSDQSQNLIHWLKAESLSHNLVQISQQIYEISS